MSTNLTADDVGPEENSGRELLLSEIEGFIEQEIESMDGSGEWSTHAINALLCLQSRVDAKLEEMKAEKR